MLSDFVKYVKQYWHDRPDKSTPLNADRLNHIENGIASNSEAINQIANAVVSNIVNDPEKIASMAAVYALQEKLGTGELPSDAPNAISAINTLYSNLNSLIKIAEVGVTDAIPINPSSKEVNTSISFQKSYTDPIVIATLCGGQGYVGAGCKVMSVKNNGATFKTYTTSPVGSDYSFYISYLVVVKNNQFKYKS